MREASTQTSLQQGPNPPFCRCCSSIAHLHAALASKGLAGVHAHIEDSSIRGNRQGFAIPEYSAGQSPWLLKILLNI